MDELAMNAPPIVAGDCKERKLWSVEDVAALFALSFSDLIFRAQQTHREHFDPNVVQLSTLLSIRTGGCAEAFSYCLLAQSYHTGVASPALLSLEEVVEAA